jgi:hypothetical protein
MKKSGNANIKLIAGIGAGVALLAGAVIIGLDWNTHYHTLMAESVKWKITGPPCESVTREVFEKTMNPFAPDKYAANLKFEFDDYAFAHSTGDVSCREVLLDGNIWLNTSPVCQFAHPIKIAMTGPSGAFYFATKDAPVTITVVNGRPVCVLNAWYRQSPNSGG